MLNLPPDLSNLMDPSTLELVWSGSASEVDMTSLSKQGNGFYLIKGTASSLILPVYSLVYVIEGQFGYGTGSVVLTTTSTTGVLNVAGEFGNGSFKIRRQYTNLSTPSVTAIFGTVQEIYKV